MKPTVVYVDLGFCEIGKPAKVIPLNHPLIVNRVWATTSPVQAISYTPIGPRFETANTLYRPYDEGEETTIDELETIARSLNL